MKSVDEHNILGQVKKYIVIGINYLNFLISIRKKKFSSLNEKERLKKIVNGKD